MGLESFSSKVINQENTEKTVADRRKQALLLIKFAENNFLVQYIKDSTRLDNLLDLFFTNDPLLVIRVRQMMNTKLSDPDNFPLIWHGRDGRQEDQPGGHRYPLIRPQERQRRGLAQGEHVTAEHQLGGEVRGQEC